MHAAAAGTSPLRHALALLPWPLSVVLHASLIAWQVSLGVQILRRREEWPSALIPFMLFIALCDAVVVFLDVMGSLIGAGVRS